MKPHGERMRNCNIFPAHQAVVGKVKCHVYCTVSTIPWFFLTSSSSGGPRHLRVKPQTISKSTSPLPSFSPSLSSLRTGPWCRGTNPLFSPTRYTPSHFSTTADCSSAPTVDRVEPRQTNPVFVTDVRTCFNDRNHSSGKNPRASAGDRTPILPHRRVSVTVYKRRPHAAPKNRLPRLNSVHTIVHALPSRTHALRRYINSRSSIRHLVAACLYEHFEGLRPSAAVLRCLVKQPRQ